MLTNYCGGQQPTKAKGNFVTYCRNIVSSYYIEVYCDEYSVAWEWRYPNSLAGNGSLRPQQCISI